MLTSLVKDFLAHAGEYKSSKVWRRRRTMSKNGNPPTRPRFSDWRRALSSTTRYNPDMSPEHDSHTARCVSDMTESSTEKIATTATQSARLSTRATRHTTSRCSQNSMAAASEVQLCIDGFDVLGHIVPGTDYTVMTASLTSQLKKFTTRLAVYTYAKQVDIS